MAVLILHHFGGTWSGGGSANGVSIPIPSNDMCLLNLSLHGSKLHAEYLKTFGQNSTLKRVVVVIYYLSSGIGSE